MPEVYWMLIGSSNCSRDFDRFECLLADRSQPASSRALPVGVEHERVAKFGQRPRTSASIAR